MKFVLCFLLCLVTVTYQQQYMRPYYQQNPSQNHRLQYFYFPNAPQPYNPPTNNYYGGGGYPNRPEERGIFQNLFSSFLPKRTVFTTVPVTTTLIVAAFQSCIAAAQFEADTTACVAARRRRSPDIMDSLIEVTPVLPLQPTMAALMSNDFLNDVQSNSEISSSMLGMLEPDYQIHARFLAQTTTLTVSTTTTAFSTTTIKKSYSLAAEGALLCLPPGYTIC